MSKIFALASAAALVAGLQRVDVPQRTPSGQSVELVRSQESPPKNVHRPARSTTGVPSRCTSADPVLPTPALNPARVWDGHPREACRHRSWSRRRMFLEILAVERRYAASSSCQRAEIVATEDRRVQFIKGKDRDAYAAQERMAYHLFPDGGDYRTAS